MKPGRWLVVLAACVALPWGAAWGKEVRKMNGLQLTSSAFANGGAIPAAYTCDGGDRNPPLAMANVPAGTRSLALIMDDPDAPVGLWVHWVLWNIHPRTSQVGENSVPDGATQGRNSWGRSGYGGPCPPSGTHRYFFKLYALDTILNLGTGTTKADLERAMEGHIIAKAELMGTYKRR